MSIMITVIELYTCLVYRRHALWTQMGASQLAPCDTTTTLLMLFVCLSRLQVPCSVDANGRCILCTIMFTRTIMLICLPACPVCSCTCLVYRHHALWMSTAASARAPICVYIQKQCMPIILCACLVHGCHAQWTPMAASRTKSLT